MQKKIIDKKLIDFYEEYELKDPVRIMTLIIFTCGLYLVFWLYTTNFEFQKLDEDAPDAKKAIILILCVPIVWYIITIILSYLIMPEIPIIADTIKVIGWFGFTFLSLEYIYEFCKSYGRITKSSPLIWYLFIYPGYYSIILVFFDFYYTIPLIFFPIIAIPAMQAFINNRYLQVNLKRIALSFNCMYQGGHTDE